MVGAWAGVSVVSVVHVVSIVKRHGTDAWRRPPSSWPETERA